MTNMMMRKIKTKGMIIMKMKMPEKMTMDHRRWNGCMTLIFKSCF